MRRILLVSPDSDNESLWITGEEASAGTVMNNMVPLGLATVAALTPPDIHVDIWDEVVHGRIGRETASDNTYDLVGITGYKTHMPRCREIAAVFRERGTRVAIGGPGVSGTPEAYRGDFDMLFIGEAERTWPQFLKDWEAGCHRDEYRQIVKPDLTNSPLPRWDSLVHDLPKYAMGCVQTTRGCPFDCEFCDVIYLFGRRARHKPIERVLEEVRALQRLGMASIFFCDDEFLGDPRYAKTLLRALIPLNNSFPRPLTYSTQLTMNLSKDERLLELMADANFDLVFIGVETPNRASLRETSKHQNLRKDLARDVRRILSYGIAIRAGIIVGFDHDDASIFDTQFDFINQACLPSVAINMLKAPLGTRLWSRLRKDDRVITLAKVKDRLGHARSYTNIVPKLMSRIQLMQGYRGLLLRVHTWEAFRRRMCGFASLVRRRPNVSEEPLSASQARRWCGVRAKSAAGRSAIDAIIDHTQEVAPFMMRRIKTAIVQFAEYQESLARLIPQIDRQIDMESTGEFPLKPDDRPITVSDGFRAAYPGLFADVCGRVQTHLKDPDQLPEALTEIFVDFLVHSGEEFRAPSPYHSSFLREIGDRTCARLNGQTLGSSVPVRSVTGAAPPVRRNRLAEDVFTSIEQELLKHVTRTCVNT